MRMFRNVVSSFSIYRINSVITVTRAEMFHWKLYNLEINTSFIVHITHILTYKTMDYVPDYNGDMNSSLPPNEWLNDARPCITTIYELNPMQIVHVHWPEHCTHALHAQGQSSRSPDIKHTQWQLVNSTMRPNHLALRWSICNSRNVTLTQTFPWE